MVENVITDLRMIAANSILMTEPFFVLFYILYVICGISDMADGFIARKTNTESETGAILDSVEDIIFIVVCLIMILPVISISTWLWMWIAVIALIKVINIISGYVCRHKLMLLHTVANKVTGVKMFVLLLTISFIDIDYSAIPVCIVAMFAAVQEGYFIRTGNEA